MVEEKKVVVMEQHIAEIINEIITEAQDLSRSYNISRVEALLVMNRIELAKIHSHIDTFLEKVKK